MQVGKNSQSSGSTTSTYLQINNSESSRDDHEFSNGTASNNSPSVLLLHSPQFVIPSTSSIAFVQESPFSSSLRKRSSSSSVDAMREVIFRVAMMQPIHVDPESVKPPKRKNVRISRDPQSVAARRRRERISEKIRILQRLVPGGTKMDTASMLDEAAHYLKFLKKQVQSLEQSAKDGDNIGPSNMNIIAGSIPNFQ